MTGKLIRQGDTYKWGDLLLAPDPTELVLSHLYEEWKNEAILDKVFYAEPISLVGFLQLFTSKAISVLGAYQGESVVGLVWINQTWMLPAGWKRAEVAMSFRKGIPPNVLSSIGEMALEWGFKERGLHEIYGTTPAQNRAAIAFGKRLGFDVAGPVHGLAQWGGQMADAYIQTLTKEMWDKLSPFVERPVPEAVAQA